MEVSRSLLAHCRPSFASLVRLFGVITLFAGVIVLCEPVAQAQVVPGTGEKLILDNFEDPKWMYYPKSPKSSNENDERTRSPGGISLNGKFFEGAKRGQPDVVRRVDTPEGGLEGSKGSMEIRTLYSGIPGRVTNQNQQDDLIMNVTGKVGTQSVSVSPNAVVRVYVPPFEQFEQRTGNSFGFRTAARRNPTGGDPEDDIYWPGMFVHFNSKKYSKLAEDSAYLIIRSDERGRDFRGPKITPGWWTLGISYTPDGKVHYYAHEGIEDLTEKDLLASHFPYGMRARYFTTIFFDVVNRDDGKSWSTSWIVDDPTVYVIRGQRQPVQRGRGR